MVTATKEKSDLDRVIERLERELGEEKERADLDVVIQRLEREFGEEKELIPPPTPDDAPVPVPATPPPSQPPLTLERKRGFLSDFGFGHPGGELEDVPAPTEGLPGEVPGPEPEFPMRMLRAPAIGFSTLGAGIRELAAEKTMIDGDGTAIFPQAISEENPMARALALDRVYSPGEEFLIALEGGEEELTAVDIDGVRLAYSNEFAGTGTPELSLGEFGPGDDMNDPRVQAAPRIVRGAAIDVYVGLYTGGQFTKALMPMRFTARLSSYLREGSEFSLRKATKVTSYRLVRHLDDGSVLAVQTSGTRAGKTQILRPGTFEAAKVELKSIGLLPNEDIAFKHTDVLEITKGSRQGLWEVVDETPNAYKLKQFKGKGSTLISKSAATRVKKDTVVRSLRPFGGIKGRPPFIATQKRLWTAFKQGKQMNRTVFARVGSEELATTIRGAELEKGVKPGLLSPAQIKAHVAADTQARTGIPILDEGYNAIRIGNNSMMAESDGISVVTQRIFGAWSRKMSTVSFNFRSQIQKLANDIGMEASLLKTSRAKVVRSVPAEQRETARLLLESYDAIHKRAGDASVKMLSPKEYVMKYIDLVENTTRRVDELAVIAGKEGKQFSRSGMFKRLITKQAEDIGLELPTLLTERGTAGSILALRSDSEHLFGMYKAAYLREKYLTGPMLRMKELVRQLPDADMRAYWSRYMDDALGAAAEGEAATQQRLRRLVGAIDSVISKPGKIHPMVATLERHLDKSLAIRAVSNHMYKVFLGWSPASAVKNFTQKLLNVMVMGEYYTARGLGMAHTRIGKRLVDETKILGRSVAFAEEINAPLKWFSKADVHNRRVAYLGSLDRFEDTYGRFLAGEISFQKFQSQIDLDFLHPAVQISILDKIQGGQVVSGWQDIRQLNKIITKGGKGRERALVKLVGEGEAARLLDDLGRKALNRDELLDVVLAKGFNKESAAHQYADWHQLITQFPYEAGASPEIFRGTGFGGLAKPLFGVFQTWWVNYAHLLGRVVRQTGRSPHRGAAKVARYFAWATATEAAAEHALKINVGGWFGMGPWPVTPYRTPLSQVTESASTAIRSALQEQTPLATEFDTRTKEQAANLVFYNPIAFVLPPQLADEIVQGLGLPEKLRPFVQIPTALVGKPFGISGGRMIHAVAKALAAVLRGDEDEALQLLGGFSPTRK